MENFGQSPNLGKSLEKKDDVFSVLNSSLKGKTEDDLTLEQKIEEEKFYRENLEKLLELIEKEKIMVHASRAPIKVILKEGLLSAMRRNENGDIRAVVGDIDNFQYRNMQVLIRESINPFLSLYKEYLSNSISQDEYEEEKQKIIEKVPTVGRKRVAHFLNIVIPKIIDKSGLPEAISSNGVNLLHNSIPSMRKRENAFKMTTAGSADALFWEALASVVGGDDLISAVHGSSLKKKFEENNSRSSALGGEQGNYDIYFDTPDEVRLFDISGGEEWEVESILQNYDTAVSSRIRPEKFRAIRFGIFDKNKRILFLPEEKLITLQDTIALSDLQKRGVLLFDSGLAPLPPLESIQISDFSIGASEVDNQSESSAKIFNVIKENGYKWGKNL